MAAIVAAGIITLIVLHATGRGGGHGGQSETKPGKDTPDYSRLPPPQPGGRNPNYLSTGHFGGVASEVGVCSQIGIDGELQLLASNRNPRLRLSVHQS